MRKRLTLTESNSATFSASGFISASVDLFSFTAILTPAGMVVGDMFEGKQLSELRVVQPVTEKQSAAKLM